MDSTYNHAEAFCLMNYRCEKCKTIEVLWNSRDGVTPYIINCEKCDGHMQHIMGHDVRQENYIPKIGQRIFINMPLDYYKVYCRVKAKYIKEHTDGCMEKIQKIYNGLVREYKETDPFIVKIR